MNQFLWILFYLSAIVGHTSFWIGLFNRMHGTSLNIRWIRRSSYPFIALGIICLPVILFLVSRSFNEDFDLTPNTLTGLVGGWGVYCWFCQLMFFWTMTCWIGRKINQWKPSAQLRSHQQTRYDFAASAKKAERNSVERFFASIPGNQIYQCKVEEREILLPGISAQFDGFTITHLSDFHFTGNICASYFEKVIETANCLESDLIAMTGDFIDNIQCWDWIPEILGKLTAPQGVLFILGNHDQRIGRESDLRELLKQCGMIDVSDRWLPVSVGEATLHVAGNELPWFGKSMSIGRTPETLKNGDCRLLLSHTPDQWNWALSHEFDLVLAGHTHGGQIQIPGIGPIVSPSKYGVKYASGMFVNNEKVMVVTRGVSGEEPIRLFCPPEIGKITIRTNDR